MTWVSVNSCMPCRPSSQPMPLALNPPNGAVGGGLTITVLPAISAYGRLAARIASGQLNG